MVPSGAMRKWYARSGQCFSFCPHACMLRTKTSGATLPFHSTPAWWMVIHCGVCLRESGMGSGLDPHCCAETILGRAGPAHPMHQAQAKPQATTTAICEKRRGIDRLGGSVTDGEVAEFARAGGGDAVDVADVVLHLFSHRPHQRLALGLGAFHHQLDPPVI